MSLISQVASIVSWIVGGIFILIGVALIIIFAFGIYKLVMWILFSKGSKKDEDSKIKKEVKEDDISLNRS